MIHVIFDLLARTEANLWVVGLGGCDSKTPGWPRKLRRKDGYPAKFITPYFFAALRDGGAHFKERIFISKHFSRGAFTSEMKKLPLKGSLKDRLVALPHATRLFA
ncbi:hypothetical protein D7X99_36175 [Corallococcus sp. AB032C]|uniref:hypothetical protein n=1 Tax=Corallococcus TaxID=83461 RepID=UPI000EC7CE26|nr:MULTISPECIES: hypothetical protein [Corallococcus]NPC50368.1 hypothetical protein [Corallococcus exiguus]RKH76017.1 hypothetical protein D7X99_36175 [Corallococcus sp. AB032C]